MLADVVASALLYTLLGLFLGESTASLHCAVRREISPCSCSRQDRPGSLLVECERVPSYTQIAEALRGRFSIESRISLYIGHSELYDLFGRSFHELGLSITNLKLNHDNISVLDDGAFEHLESLTYLSLADNALPVIPRYVLRHMPDLHMLDMGRNKIDILTSDCLKDVPQLQDLVLRSNGMSMVEKHSMPPNLKRLIMGKNRLTSLNGTLRDLDKLQWLFVNNNKLTSIDNELPMKANNLRLIYAAQNQIEHLPKDLWRFPSLEGLYIYENKINNLNGALRKAKMVTLINLSFNKLEALAYDDFIEAVNLARLDVGHNRLKTLNGSLTHLRSLRYLNLTHNELPEFSLRDIKGLKRLDVIDLSHNRITHLNGDMENLIELETTVLELRLQHNRLHNLGGALMGVHGLLRLNVSHNELDQIAPDDLIGLDELKVLDVSHNQITTLEETSKTFLPALEELLASHNNITMLDKDFHGLPALCWADLSYNSIKTINHELVSKTRCSVQGVPSILKLYLQDNPILCDDRLLELTELMKKWNTRLHGMPECLERLKPVSTPMPLMVPAVLMNDILPAPLPPAIILSQNLRPAVAVVPLENQIHVEHIFQSGGVVGQIIPSPDGGLPIIVEQPITLPPATEPPPTKPPEVLDAGRAELPAASLP